MKRKWKVGILGATGTVGQRFIQLLERHPWFEVGDIAASGGPGGRQDFEGSGANRWIVAPRDARCAVTSLERRLLIGDTCGSRDSPLVPS